MWNDTDLPLGYLITFRCYGTWLHGDKRGSIDRLHNRYDFWLTKLNQFGGNFQNAEMVKAFITSIEYRQRFGL